MKCPFCAEEIQEDAKKCKHCNEWLGEGDRCPKCNTVKIKNFGGRGARLVITIMLILTISAFIPFVIFASPFLIYYSLVGIKDYECKECKHTWDKNGDKGKKLANMLMVLAFAGIYLFFRFNFM